MAFSDERDHEEEAYWRAEIEREAREELEYEQAMEALEPALIYAEMQREGREELESDWVTEEENGSFTQIDIPAGWIPDDNEDRDF